MTNQPAPDTWHCRDLPVLREIVRLLDEGTWGASAATVAIELEMDEADVRRAFKNLHRGGYVEFPPPHVRRGGFQNDEVVDVNGDALRTAGAWPTPETGADRLIAALEAVAEQAPDEPTRTRARAALAQLAGLGRDTLAAVAATVITGQIPGSGS